MKRTTGYVYATNTATGTGAPVRRGRRVTVHPWETALVFRDGAVVDRLGPGSRRRWTTRTTVRRIDLRPWLLAVPTQEVPTAEGVTVRLTVSAQCRITDAERWVTGTQDAYATLYLAVQVALRELVAGLTVEDLVGGRRRLGDELRERVPSVGEVGVAVERTDVKDVILPAELKRAQAQVLLARAEGLASLERARGETAALRSLANAARLMADNPALLQLRLLQGLEASTGHTVVVGSALPPLAAAITEASTPGSH